jgi:zinc/manganese transport system substrate-binding protein
MKRFVITLLLLVASHASLAKLQVLSCEPEWAALVREIGGSEVEIFSATTALQDPHSIQARPSLIAQARQADLLLCTGAGLEAGWLPLLLKKSANPKIQEGASGFFMASSHVNLLGKGGAADRSRGDVHPGGNPHIQANPANMLAVADALLPVMVQLQPQSRESFTANHAQFRQKLLSMLERLGPEAAKVKGRKIVVHHDNWAYLNRWLGLVQVATLEPKPGVPPTTGHLASLSTRLVAEPADLILYATYQDGKAAGWLAAKSNIPAMGIPATVSDWQAPDALVSWYEAMLRSLAGAVK